MRKNRMEPRIRSRLTVLIVGTFFSAIHMTAALIEASETAPIPPPNQYR
jgi:hypothetical protein